MHHERTGSGKPLLLVHGLGANLHSWRTVAPDLARHREVIALDLPGHGRSPAEPGSGTFAGLARSLSEWLEREGLTGIDMVGSSMGARLVLEMARRRKAGAVVALDPGGFWRGWERVFFKTTIAVSIRLVRALRPLLPTLADTAIGRTVLMAQLSAKPWNLSPDLVASELRSYADTKTFDALVKDLATGPMQQGVTQAAAQIAIGWGRKDRLCLPRQAARALAAFPDARLHWFEHSGHFPMWDEPGKTIELILRMTTTPAPA